MKSGVDNSVSPWRYRFILLLLFLISASLVWRLVYLTLIDQSFLRNQGNARTLRMFRLPAYRGIITDRQGEPLAVSTPVKSVWINPKTFSATPKQLHQLSNLLSMSMTELKKRIPNSSTTHVEFVYLKRHIQPAIAANVDKLAVPGIHLQQEFRRYYPEGEVTAQLVGFTNIDDRGQEGMELAYDSWLRGEAGKKRVLVDRLGQAVSDLGIVKEVRPGHDLVLSVDKRLQYLAYRELKEAVVKYKAESGSVVILQPQTGEVLAMANYPSFNPNKRFRRGDGSQRNRAVTDLFEPGSTMKAFSIANALASGRYQPDTKISVSPGKMKIGRNIVKDPHGDLGTIDLTTILSRSSNVGVAKLTLSLPSDSLPNLLYKAGISHKTNSGFPGESSGTMQSLKPWQRFSLATQAFGYAFSVTNLQLAQAYSIFATGGLKYPVTLLRAEQAPQGEQVLTKQVADTMLTMLESDVTSYGTRRVGVKGYRVAGKTGTTRMLGPNGYQIDHHIASFAGIAPVSHPQFVISVVVKDPKGFRYYGGQIAAPLFSRILTGALRIAAASPDQQKVASSS